MSQAPAKPPGGDRFRCTPGGSIAAGQRRLGCLLLGLAALMLGVAGAVLWGGRVLPGLLSAGVALVAWTAWRMSRDLAPLWIEAASGRLVVQTRRQRLEVPLDAATARRLEPDELAHLERLASVGGLVAGTGGFDSHRLGEFDLYASDLGNAVLVEAGDHRLIVTPDDPDGLVRALG